MADKEIGGLIVKIKGDMNDLDQKLKKAGAVTEHETDKITKSFQKVNTILASVGLGVATFAATAVKSASDWGNAVDDLSDKTGLAGEEASKLLVIAKATGVSADEANLMFARLSRTIYTSSDAYAKAAEAGQQSDDILTKLGISALDAEGNMRSTVEVFKNIKNALNSMDDGWQKTALEMELFGRTGYQVHDMLAMTDADMQKAIDKAQSMGLIISSKTAAGWEQFDRQLKSTKGTMTSVGILLGNEMLPTLDKGLGKVQGIVKEFIAWKDANPQLASSLGSVSTAILAIAAAVKVLELAALRVPAWAIPGSAAWAAGAMPLGAAATIGAGTIIIGTQIAQSEGAQGSAENDYSSWTNKDRPVTATSGVGSGDLRALERNMKPVDSDPPDNKFLGGGGSGGLESKTALQTYLEAMQKEISLWQKQIELGELSREQFQTLLSERLNGLNGIAVGNDEVLDKLQAQVDLTLQIRQSGEQQRKEAVETAEQRFKQGQITLETMITEIDNQVKLAQSDKERNVLLEKRLQIYRSLVDYDTLGRNLEDQAQQDTKALVERVNKYAESYKDEIDLEQRRGVEKQNLLTRLLQEEQSYQSKKDSMSREEWEKETGRQLVRADLIKQLNRDIVNESIDAARRNQEAWADNLADLITQTRDAHDILKAQWRDFVRQVIAEQWKISANSNIFSGLLGGLFGNNGVNLTGTRPVDVSGPVGSNGGFYKISGAGGWDIPDIPGDIPMYVHRKEMLLPADLSEKIRNMTDTGAKTVPNVTVTQTFNGPQDSSVVAQIKAAVPYIKKEIAEAMMDEPYMRNAVKKASGSGG